MNLVERVKRTQRTVDAFKGKTFKDGRYDCVQLVKVHAQHMGKPLKVPRYSDLKGAAEALKSLGFKSLGEALDARFTRIEANRVLAGDIVETLGANGFSALLVALGNGRALGFHEEIPHCDILQPLIVSGVWRIGKL